jgi:hypothetical protein
MLHPSELWVLMIYRSTFCGERSVYRNIIQKKFTEYGLIYKVL